MTRPPEDMTGEFHDTFGLPHPDQPTMPSVEDRFIRALLHVEETAELVAELLAGVPDSAERIARLAYIFADRAAPTRDRPDLAAILRELADNQYINAGTATVAGLPLTAAYAEVHRANMAKLGPDGRPDVDGNGKVRKPEGWQPPNIAAVLAGTAVRPGIRPVTYWEAWCAGDGSGEHLVETGDFTAWRQDFATVDDVTANDGVVLPDGRVYCADHIPAVMCSVADDFQHQPADDNPAECGECGASLPAATPQAVTA